MLIMLNHNVKNVCISWMRESIACSSLLLDKMGFSGEL
jgi:hypothetical protein